MTNRLWQVFGALGVAVGLLAALSMAYLIAPAIYRVTGVPRSAYVQLLAVSILGITILAIALGVLTLVKRDYRPEDIFGSMNDLLGQIAKGNFSAKMNLDDKYLASPDNPIGGLVTSVNNMATQLQHMETMRQEFVSNVSHEIQSPLTSIHGFAQALRNPNLTEMDKEHYLDIIEAETQRLSKLSDNLLNLASLDSEHHPFRPRPFRLDRQLRSIALLCRPQWAEKNIDLDVDLPEAVVEADEDLLSQVWINLLSNSIKFTQRGGTIRIHLDKGDQEVLVRVSDNGLGISAEEKERIFERFYKADKSHSRAVGGSGLGLAIVQKITEMHHGAIDVESKLGEGTTFIVHLPLE